ncbi:polyprenyl synthetase family protein [Porticoccus sp. W117]|uniref:polyprenyl synthetase family protein n=1 Tax=Porticoccus sp. W117 TaxID=3054777 RepID=UPI0025948941|nr:farnesyl diphosphate synthase [Porticoccus sp. W117]MDM3871599.1 polyprenyl synthetase family protein [Porticoccus sp. W117]
MTSPLEQLQAITLERVNAALNHCLSAHADANSLHQAMEYSVLNGGKRVRPMLAYGAAMAVGDINTDTDRAACALELIHAYSLIHDDLPAMDDDDLRRGNPTCHVRFGEANAILAGDALQALAFEQLTQLDHTPAQQALQMIAKLTQAAGAQGMVAGQAIDLAAVDQTLSLQQLEQMHHLKTGALIDASIQLGALSAGASASQLTALAKYSRLVGLAFQVQDDILDVESNTAVLGKRQGADQALNKPTYTSLLGLEGAKQKAAQLYSDSLDALSEFDQRADGLRAVADYIVTRRY